VPWTCSPPWPRCPRGSSGTASGGGNIAEQDGGPNG
jgi:hypothetical protein